MSFFINRQEKGLFSIFIGDKDINVKYLDISFKEKTLNNGCFIDKIKKQQNVFELIRYLNKINNKLVFGVGSC